MEFSTGVRNMRPLPGRMADLEAGEHLLLWSLRRWLCGLMDDAPGHWRIVEREFTGRYGAEPGRQLLVGLVRMIALLQSHAERKIVYHRPCCPCVGEDEAALISYIAACQDGDWPAARAGAAGLVAEAGIGDLLETGVRLADQLRNRGAHLPRRAAPVRSGEPVTIH